MRVVVLTKDVPNASGLPPEIGPDFRLRRDEGGQLADLGIVGDALTAV